MTPSFDTGKALVFAWDVFKARPTGTIILSLYQVIAMTAVGILSLLPMAMFGMEYMEAVLSNDPARIMQAGGQMFGYSFLAYIPMMLIFILVEAAWLRLLVKGQTRLMPTGRDELNIFLIGLVLFGVYLLASFAAVILVVILVLVLGETAGFIIGALLMFFMIIASLIVGVWALVKVSPAGALSVLQGRFALVSAWKGTRPIFWNLLGTWFVWLILYIVGMTIAFAIAGFIPTPLADAMVPDWTNTDPFAAFSAYESIFASTSNVIASIVTLAILQLVYVPFIVIGRGIAAKAALHIDEAAQPSEPASSEDSHEG